MIRLHLVPDSGSAYRKAYPSETYRETYRVSARRVPKGYVRMVHGTKEVRYMGKYTASVNYVAATWWVAMDLEMRVLPKYHHPKDNPDAERGRYDHRYWAIQRVLAHASTQPPIPRPPASGKWLKSTPIVVKPKETKDLGWGSALLNVLSRVGKWW